MRDLARAVAFHRDTLGMTYLFETPTLAFLDCGGVRLMLSRPEAPADGHAASILYYQVEDIAAAYEALRQRGVDFIDTSHLIARLSTHDLWMVFLRDSERNTLALMCERPIAGGRGAERVEGA